MVVMGDGDGVLEIERQGSPVTPGENYHDNSQALVRGQIRLEQIESELFVKTAVDNGVDIETQM